MEAVGANSPPANQQYSAPPPAAYSPPPSDTDRPSLSGPPSLQVTNPSPAFAQSSGEFRAAQPSYSSAANPAPDAAPKPRKSRQPALADGKPATAAEPKEKKPRKPRQPRDPNDPPRKRAKTAKDDSLKQPPATGPDQPVHFITQAPSAFAPAPSRPLAAEVSLHDTNRMSQDPSSSQPPRPSASGQRYDPIRAASAENAQSYGYPPVPGKNPPPPPPFRSPPSMSMLLNNPTSSTTSLSQSVSHPQGPTGSHGMSASYPAQQPSAATAPSAAVPPTNKPPKVSPAYGKAINGTGRSPSKANSPHAVDSAMNAMPQRDGSPSRAPTQLLSNARPTVKPKDYAVVTNECIVIDIPMTSDGGAYVNFMKEVEQKYGFDVAYPQIAEHRRRMKDMAAAGALLETGPGSGDEMNLDVSEQSDADMGGVDENSAQEGPTKGRRKQRNDYNKDDDFIDDTELAWEEQALASRDGYFVWSGPLVQQGDKPTIERADGTIKRGRGSRGRGGTTRGDAAAGRSRGVSGRGSRGGNVIRKPRVTKADRAKMESERQERERMAATASKSGFVPTTPL